MSDEDRIAGEERSKLLQHYLTAVASYLEANKETTDEQAVEQLRSEVENAFASLERL